jgi:hypothetical protein
VAGLERRKAIEVNTTSPTATAKSTNTMTILPERLTATPGRVDDGLLLNSRVGLLLLYILFVTTASDFKYH